MRCPAQPAASRMRATADERVTVMDRSTVRDGPQYGSEGNRSSRWALPRVATRWHFARLPHRLDQSPRLGGGADAALLEQPALELVVRMEGGGPVAHAIEQHDHAPQRALVGGGEVQRPPRPCDGEHVALLHRRLLRR